VLRCSATGHVATPKKRENPPSSEVASDFDNPPDAGTRNGKIGTVEP
jgi:hypothetical protein